MTKPATRRRRDERPRDVPHGVVRREDRGAAVTHRFLARAVGRPIATIDRSARRRMAGEPLILILTAIFLASAIAYALVVL